MPQDRRTTDGSSRGLTPAEGVVVRALLAARPISEKERARDTGLPPRTYHAVRQRVLREGWVVDRYLPDLGLLGSPQVSFAIGQPFEERAQELKARWSDDPRNLLLWAGPQTLFGVFEGARVPGLEDDSAGWRRSLSMTVDLREYGIPVYFDFEASWNRLLGSPSSAAYPHPWFGEASPSEAAEPPGAAGTLSPGARASVLGLVRRPFETSERGALRSGPFYAPRSQQRALEAGWVQRRLFLDPFLVPTVQGQGIRRVVLIHGKILPDRRPQGLLYQLLEDCRVTPFLVATDWKHVMLGALSPNPPGSGSASAAPRASVSHVLQSYLRDIEVFREPVDGFRTHVNHRYDRLSSGTETRGEARSGPRAAAKV